MATSISTTKSAGWAGRVILAIVIIGAVVAMAYVGRAWLAATAMKAQLASFGLRDVSFSITRLDIDRMTIEKFSAEGGALKIDRLEATYALVDLRARHVDKLTVDGVHLSLSLDQQGLRLGHTNVVKLLGGLSPASGSSAGFPLKAVRIAGGDIRLTTAQGVGHGTFDFATAEVNSGWPTTINLALAGGGIIAEGHATGRIDPHRIANSSAEMKLMLHGTDVIIPHVTERATFTAAFAGSAQDGTFTLTTSAPLNVSLAALDPEILASVPPMLTGFITNGVSATVGKLSLQQKRGMISMTMSVGDADVQGEGGSITGLAEEFALTPTVPPAFQDTATVTAASVAIGNLTLANVHSEIAFPAPGQIVLKRIAFDTAGGHISSADIKLPSPDAFTLDIQQLDLHALASLAKVDGLDTQGIVSGRVPIRRDKAEFRLDSGQLAAEGPGVIHYRPAEPPASLVSSPSGALALKALSNFVYESLSLILNGSVDGNVELTVAIKGRNPDLYNGYPVALNLALSGKLLDILRQGFGDMHVPSAALEQLRALPGISHNDVLPSPRTGQGKHQ